MSSRFKRKIKKRPRFKRRTSHGAPPGVVSIAPAPALHNDFHVTCFNSDVVTEKQVDQVVDFRTHLSSNQITWIDVRAIASGQALTDFAAQFEIHPLSIEDVVNVHQRAKVESYDNYLFVVVRLPVSSEPGQSEQVSLFIGNGWLITLQERPDDSFQAVRQRIRDNAGKIRSQGADYLAYCILDLVIDSYFPIVDLFAERIEDLDVQISTSRSQHVMTRIHDVRNELLVMRRSVRPHREAMLSLSRNASEFVRSETQLYIRDCYDHVIQLMDMMDIYWEMCSDLRDFYLSIVSYRMNDIMKVLTIISTLFIPLSFITSLYGMNFDTRSPWNMPETQWRFGYFSILGGMAFVAVGLLYYFKRKGWLLEDGQFEDSNEV